MPVRIICPWTHFLHMNHPYYPPSFILLAFTNLAIAVLLVKRTRAVLSVRCSQVRSQFVCLLTTFQL
jgi:hypothetical protein